MPYVKGFVFNTLTPRAAFLEHNINFTVCFLPFFYTKRAKVLTRLLFPLSISSNGMSRWLKCALCVEKKKAKSEKLFKKTVPTTLLD